MNTAPPTISGTAQQGQTLTESQGSWTNNPTGYTYQWQQCDSAGVNCTTITGAIAQTYVPVAADVGHTIEVQETASNEGGPSIPAASAATSEVVPPPPVNSAPPTISGTAQQGQTLTESHGTWTNNPTGYTYVWQQCDSLGTSCLPITGANAQTYVPVAADVGHTIEVQETASNAGGSSAPATSAATSVVLPAVMPVIVPTSPPTISGTPQQGQTLTEHHGTWSNGPTGYTYQWLQCDSLGTSCTEISGANSQTYVPVAADVGHTIEVQETASNEGGSSPPATSAATGEVVPPVPVNSAAPTISGTAQQGQTLTESQGTWSNSPTGYTYQWLQCDSLAQLARTEISGANSQTYVPVAADVGHTIKVQETASNEGGSSAPATSAATSAVLPAPPVNTSPPTISGTAQQGQTLTESHGTWTNSPTGYAYQWLQCDGAGANCTIIKTATAETYVPVAGDVGHTIEVQETASNAGGSSGPASAGPTGAVQQQPPPGNTAPPTVSGIAQQGQTLTESHGTWSSNPTGYTYQWQQCDSAGANCTTITGANAQTYVLVAADVGHTINVQETASNAGGSSTPTASAATSEVVPPVPVNTAPPTISGTAQQGQTLSESHGTWSNSPTSYTYQWLQCDSLGSQLSTHRRRQSPNLRAGRHRRRPHNRGAGDRQQRRRVKQPGSVERHLGRRPAASGEQYAPPTISGTAQQGQTLTESHATWTNNPASYTYQWQQCDNAGANCTTITGANSQTYIPPAADVGHTIKVQETASNEGGSSAPAASAATSIVVPPVPVNTSPPTISGTVQQGQTLTESHGTWSNSPTSYTYQWLRCDNTGANCTTITGANAQTYISLAADVGHTLKVQETASNEGGSSAPATSAATSEVVPPVPVNTAAPTISGTAQPGQTLTESHGTWSNNPTGYTYQWQRCDNAGANCTTITGANSQTYVPVAADVGHTLKVQETASNAGGSSTPATSAATNEVIPPAPVNSVSPTIAGTAQQGQTLTESHGTWSNNPTGYTYQWQQCDSAGANCTTITNANSQTYVPVAANVGHTLKVQETASNAGGSSTPATSAATDGSRPAGAGEQRPADDLGHRPAGPDAHREPRHVEQQPDQLHLPVAALRQRGRQLHDHHRRQRPDLRARGRRRGPHDQGAGDREQRRRLEHSVNVGGHQ